MIHIQKISIAVITAFMTILIASCTSNNFGMPTEMSVAAEDIANNARSAAEETLADEQDQKNKSSKKTLSWKPSSQAENNAVIKLGRDEELKPEALDISVQIDGFRARVVIDGFYTNPHNRNLEGSFKFRLPNGVVPYFFAFGETATSIESNLKTPLIFDTPNQPLSRLSPQSLMGQRASRWLEPKEAIMVSREKAAFAYNDTVARQVDPALLEWAGAGGFSAKVFPLQARKTHRVVLGYALNLNRFDKDLILDLPVTNDSIQKRINLFINQKAAKEIVLNRIIKDELQAPVIISKNNELVQQTIEGTDFNGIRVTVKQHANVALMGQDEAGSFFSKQRKVDFPATDSASHPRAVFALDTSLSASPEKFHLWVKLIEKILLENESEITEFSLLTFNIHSHWWKKAFVKNTTAQRQELKTYLNQLILEGATDLASALNSAAAPKWWTEESSDNQNSNKQFDLFLLSDGAITWGEKESFFISESIKKNINKFQTVNQLYTYRLGQSGEDIKLLTHLTREIGGGSYQLTNDTDLDQLATAHKMVPWKIESVELKGANDILISGRPNSVYPGQLITLTGRVLSELDNKIVLTFSKGEIIKSAQVPITIKIDSSLTSRVFGQIAVNQLESIAALEQKVASAFANHFRVPGKSSSLLMLESKEDYERYQIKPSEDAFVAGHKQISKIFAELSEGFAETLSDPKKRLIAQIEKLEKMTVINFSLPDSVSILIDDMPMNIFNISANEKISEKIDKQWVPEKYLQNLQPEAIKYDELQTEALRRYKKYSAQDAIKVLSSLIEQMPSDVAIIRDVAFAAESWGLYQQAFNLHLTAANLRPYEPQSYTYLAKLAHQLNNNDLALIYFEMGLASKWSNRFGDYELIHKLDYANFLRLSSTQETNQKFYAQDYAKLKLNSLSREINLTGSDLIVAISWNTDRTDIDLHIIEPSGEECYYKHNKTESNGFMTKDVTEGFGPEMYVNKSAPKGQYDLLVKYFSSDQNKLGLKTKVLIRTIRNWGTNEEIEDLQTVTLENQQQKQLIAMIKI